MRQINRRLNKNLAMSEVLDYSQEQKLIFYPSSGRVRKLSFLLHNMCLDFIPISILRFRFGWDCLVHMLNEFMFGRFFHWRLFCIIISVRDSGFADCIEGLMISNNLIGVSKWLFTIRMNFTVRGGTFTEPVFGWSCLRLPAYIVVVVLIVSDCRMLVDPGLKNGFDCAWVWAVCYGPRSSMSSSTEHH